MIKKILVANRGEIACRIFKTAKKLGIATVAIYSDIDKNAQHVLMADEAVLVGSAPANESYLKADVIIEKALELQVDAIHPGYGFLSENSAFAEKCHENGIVFIGPSASAIRAMGSKSAAKTIMEAASVPLVPGYHGDNQDPAFLHQQAKAMGYPVLLKAAAGGGGKGMRQVWQDHEFYEALETAKREAMKSFGDDIMLVEKYLTEPRHVEIQVFCDTHGNGVYLFERDCSVQRRHQKIIEEAPAPGLSEEVRDAMGQAALKAAFAIDYVGAGTVEFLLDKDDGFYFMEMNTRLQVEHPVTEFITGEDLVDWQIQVANGHKLPKSQEQLSINGHAFEARVYAEDPSNDFLPSTGQLIKIIEPQAGQHVRVDSGVVSGDEVSIYYDPMIAKLVVWSENREKALELLIKSLRKYMICGLTTNIPYLINVADSAPFRQAELTTDFIERHQATLEKSKLQQSPDLVSIAAICALLNQNNKVDNNQSLVNYPGFRLNHYLTKEIKFQVNNKQYSVLLKDTQNGEFQLEFEGDKLKFEPIFKDELSIFSEHGCSRFTYVETESLLWIMNQDGLIKIEKEIFTYNSEDSALNSGDISAPMNGTLVSMQVKEGQSVAKGDLLAIVEAMKMEHSLRAPFDGTVKSCYGKSGELVDGGSLLVSIEPNESK